ncbi:MAG: hypothetical protein IPI67_09870 [Myxococcales bacterium]|nr:hypothetical protein [Myxococcales bacterium]
MPNFEDVSPNAAEVEAALRGRSSTPSTAEPTERVVAILVSGRGVERSTWTDDAEVSEDDFERLLDEQPPPPDVNDLNGERFRSLDPQSRSAKIQRCTECQFRVADDHGFVRPCNVCGGKQRTVSVKVIFGEDKLRHFARIFLPELTYRLREPLTQFFKARTSVPDLLTLDLTEDFETADAYRGRRSRGEIHGHRADAALAQAKNYVERVTRLPSLLAVQAAAFAWPLVVGGAAETSFAVVKDEHGGVHVLS